MTLFKFEIFGKPINSCPYAPYNVCLPLIRARVSSKPNTWPFYPNNFVIYCTSIENSPSWFFFSFFFQEAHVRTFRMITRKKRW